MTLVGVDGRLHRNDLYLICAGAGSLELLARANRLGRQLRIAKRLRHEENDVYPPDLGGADSLNTASARDYVEHDLARATIRCLLPLIARVIDTGNGVR